MPPAGPPSSSPRHSSKAARDTLAGTRARPSLGKINIASLRAGLEIGYHEIRYETGADNLVLSHEADSRDLFAKGALAALRWLKGRKGIFTFDDVAADIIDPLFRN